MATVSLPVVGKVYDNGFQAVPGLDLDIADKEFLVLVGPSGCGKSTVLRMIAGLETISAGTLRIGDTVMNDVEPKDRDIAMVFQNYALYPHMTVYDNIAFALKLARVPKPEIDSRVRKAAAIIELEQYLDPKPAQLSGGQPQRGAMGRAIVRQPSLFLMDEPLSNLDAKLRVHTRAEIGRLQRQLGITTIYVTHDQIEAMTMSDRVAVMRSGKLEQFTPPQEVYTRPANAFVGGFIGSPAMNFLEGTLQRSNGHVSVVLGEQHLALDASILDQRPRLGAYRDRRVIVGIRPESIQDAALVPDAPRDHLLHGTVELREALGPELFIHFTAPRVEPADTESIADLPRDTTVGVDANSGALLVGRFSAHSEAREGAAI